MNIIDSAIIYIITGVFIGLLDILPCPDNIKDSISSMIYSVIEHALFWPLVITLKIMKMANII